MEMEHQIVFWLLGGAFSFTIGAYLILTKSKASKGECAIIHRQIALDQAKTDKNFESLFEQNGDIRAAVARIEAKLP